MSDVTRILSQIESGDPQAAEKLLPLVYDELRRLAARRLATERTDHTLSPTGLVHEAYLRLVGSNKAAKGTAAEQWSGRGPHDSEQRGIIEDGSLAPSHQPLAAC